MSIAEKTWFTNKQFLIILLASISFTASTVFGGAMFYYNTVNTTEGFEKIQLEFNEYKSDAEEDYDYLNAKISKKSNEAKDMIRENTKLIIELKGQSR